MYYTSLCMMPLLVHLSSLSATQRGTVTCKRNKQHNTIDFRHYIKKLWQRENNLKTVCLMSVPTI